MNIDNDYYRTNFFLDLFVSNVMFVVRYMLGVRYILGEEKPVLAFNAEHQARSPLVPFFNAFGMARPGIDPTTSQSRSGCSTTRATKAGVSVFPITNANYCKLFYYFVFFLSFSRIQSSVSPSRDKSFTLPKLCELGRQTGKLMFNIPVNNGKIEQKFKTLQNFCIYIYSSTSL